MASRPHRWMEPRASCQLSIHIISALRTASQRRLKSSRLGTTNERTNEAFSFFSILLPLGTQMPAPSTYGSRAEAPQGRGKSEYGEGGNSGPNLLGRAENGSSVKANRLRLRSLAVQLVGLITKEQRDEFGRSFRHKLTMPHFGGLGWWWLHLSDVRGAKSRLGIRKETTSSLFPYWAAMRKQKRGVPATVHTSKTSGLRL